MKKSLMFSLLCLSVLSLGACSQLSSQQSEDLSQIEQAINQPAPEFTIKDRDGKEVSLADFKGKKIYINVWASWCGPCKQEIPELEQVYQKYKDKEDYAFLSVVSSSEAEFANSRPAEQSKDKILQVAKELGVTYPVLFDSKDQVFESYQIKAFPTQLFIDSKGTLVKKIEGQVREKSLIQALESLD